MSSTFTVTRDQIIQLALRKLAVLELGDTPDPATVSNASLALNLLLKQMSTEGLKLWKIQEVIVPLTSGQTSYTLGGTGGDDMYMPDGTTLITDKPLKLIQAFYRNSSTPPVDVPIMLISRQEYNILGSKQSQGVSNSVYYDVRRDNGILNVFLTPDDYTATNNELHLVFQFPINDLSRAQDIPDFPNEWMNTLVWNLADQLAIEYAVPANHRQEIAIRASTYKEQLTSWDVESYSTFFQPDYRNSRYYGKI
jgi:hypothetical protein